MKAISLFFAFLLAFNSAAAASQTTGTRQAAKFKAQVQKRGEGEKSRVRVTLENGTIVKGYISKIEDSSFEVNAKQTGHPTSISYADVQKIQGPGLSTGVKVLIVVGVAVAIVALVIGVEYAKTGY